jgi:hypothetical protein
LKATANLGVVWNFQASVVWRTGRIARTPASVVAPPERPELGALEVMVSGGACQPRA